jgi:hypothetical protein
MKIDNIEKVLMPTRMNEVLKKIKENKDLKDKKELDLGEFVTKVAKKQMEADNNSKE